MRKPFEPPPPSGPGPADFPLGSLESRAAARRLLKSREPLQTVVYMDDDGNPIWEPGVKYARYVIYAPLPLTREEWIRRYCGSEDETPEERQAREAWWRARQERLPMLREKYLRQMRGEE